jgi:2-polyprenyl-3-methyl-5-hydroxy-6-metoxy-1,4-benzoquinol methylase
MDDPRLDRKSHVRALRGLSRINRISRSVPMIWPRVRWAARAADRPLRVLDMATGSGDLPIGLAIHARREGICMEIAGCDISPRAVAFGRLRARQRGVKARFFVWDVCDGQLPSGYDVMTCSLFLHHLAETDAVSFLRRMHATGSRLLLVDDLRRSPWGLLAAHVGTRTLTRSPIVRTDGPRSVRAAFSTTELAGLAAQAGLDTFEITRHWPWRQLLEWQTR